MTDPNSMDLGGGGSASWQFTPATPRVRGTIVNFETVPQTHFDGPQKGEPRTFPDGKPMTMVVVELQTAYRNSEGLKEAVPPAGADDGKRAVYLKANKAPDTTSTMQAVIAASTRVVGKGQLKIGAELELILDGEVKSHTGQLAKKYSANYWAPSTDLGAAPAVPTVPAAPPVAVPAAPAAVPTAPVPAAPSATGTDPLLANLTPAQLAVLGQQSPAAAVPPPPAPPVAVPPPPPPPAAPKVTPEGYTMEALLAAGWSREAVLAQYPVLA